MTTTRSIILHGRVFLGARLRTVTGLHIGGAQPEMEIGGVDNPVVRDPITQRPYVPGSSVKGKMRSLLEKLEGSPQNRRIGQVYIHTCDDSSGGEAAYRRCRVCRLFGVPGELSFSEPTRLLVRDAFLSQESAKDLETRRIDLPFTEVKWEATIDRVTSAATPRQMERVPAGVVFDGLEMIFSVYREDDLELFDALIAAMQLLEDDYLGGLGSRGSGKVRFERLGLSCRPKEGYGVANGDHRFREEPYPDLKALVEDLPGIKRWLREKILRKGVEGG